MAAEPRRQNWGVTCNRRYAVTARRGSCSGPLPNTIYRVTIQVVSPFGGLLMLLAIVVVIALVTWIVVQLARRRRQSAVRLGGLLMSMVLLYAGTLIGAGLASGPQQLMPGDTKCFDDWCASMIGAERDPATGRLVVRVRLENRGRGRAMRSDLARAYVEIPGGGLVAPRDRHALQTFLGPGQPKDIELDFDVAARTSRVRFVVTEGSDTIGPGTFTIGDEASPFHARAGWLVATS